MKILLAGESWVTHSIHIKGFDSFTTSTYAEGATPLRKSLESGGHQVEYLPNHVASESFPSELEGFATFDVIILSDIGVNTLLLRNRTFVNSERATNRLELVRQYVEQGGGLLMIGGYLSFQGIDGKAGYHGSAIEEVLPVKLLATDDRREVPQGIKPIPMMADHPILRGIEGWPEFLGYNCTILKESATLVASIGGDPFIAVQEYGMGRTGIFSSDCGPHWGPPSFLAWTHYSRLWLQLTSWLAKI